MKPAAITILQTWGGLLSLHGQPSPCLSILLNTNQPTTQSTIHPFIRRHEHTNMSIYMNECRRVENLASFRLRVTWQSCIYTNISQVAIIPKKTSVLMKQSSGTHNSIGVAVSLFADWTLSVGSIKAYFIKPSCGIFSIRGLHVERNGNIAPH